MRLWASGFFVAVSGLFVVGAVACSSGSGSGGGPPAVGPTSTASSGPTTAPTASATPTASPTASPTATPSAIAVASVAIGLGTTNPPTGTATSIPVLLTIKNAAGAKIVGAGMFQAPITLTDSDATGHTKLSTTKVTNAGTVVTLLYDGSRLVTSAVIGATVPGVSASNVTDATLSPLATAGTYAGTSLQTDAFGYPRASPLPSTSVAGSLALTLTNGSVANPAGQPATNIHSVETQTLPLFTTTETTDSWLAFSTTQTSLFGFASTDNESPVPNTLTTAYTTPQIVDALPETNGATWTNSPEASIVESDADGESAARTVNADGTYTEVDTYPNRDPYTFTNTITVNPDGSGSYTGSGFIAYGVYGLTYSAPASGIITVDVLSHQGPVLFGTVKAWYPNASFYRQQNTITTGTTFPKACAVPARYGIAGNELLQVTSRVDPVIGYTDSQTIQTYTAPSAGAVCVALSDTTDYYYDYSDDQGDAVFGFSSTPRQVATLTQTLTINSGEPYGILARDVTAGTANFRASVERQHRDRARALQSFLKRHLQHRSSLGAQR
jgi:hypothetical protein